MYNFSRHLSHGDLRLSSARFVAPILHSLFELQSVFDVGCGDGQWLASFKECGVQVVAGVDGPWTHVAKLHIEPHSFSVRDLSEPFDLQRKFSLAMSLEVAEHVEPQFSKVFVQNMIRHS